MTETFLAIDVETTGFPKSGALIQPDQARVCQLALILCDARGKVLSKFCSLIKPDGWKIHEGARKVHGISDEQCERYGVGFISAIGLFHYLASMATTVVTHNVKFDRQLLEIESAYAKEVWPMDRNWFCTMENNTHFMPGNKFPKLAEAYRHYCDKEIEGAHDALVDAEACKDIFFEMKKRKNGLNV